MSTPNITTAYDILKFTNFNVRDNSEIKTNFKEVILNRVFRHAITAGKAGIVTEELKHIFASGDTTVRNYFEPVAFIPEFIHCVLYNGNNTTRNRWRFMAETADAEYAKRNKNIDSNRYESLWTSNGDYFIRYDSKQRTYAEFYALSLVNNIPIDFVSPYCLKIDAAEINDNNSLVESKATEAFQIYAALNSTLKKLNGHDHFSIFLRHYINVIVTKTQNSISFSSSTTGLFPGRVLILNGHHVGENKLIDAAVHEAVHGLLYMIEEVCPWMPSLEVSSRAGYSLQSPWTGNYINLRNFVQAVFVWYGLYNFWNYCLENKLLDAAFAENRAEQIWKGFRELDLANLEKSNALSFDKDFKETFFKIVKHII